MKKIINGKVYNTQTSKFLGNYTFSIPGDFNYINEDLYISKKGTYFLNYEGGALSKYAVNICNHQTSSGNGIKLLDIDEAKEWAETNLSTDEVEMIFGEVEEG